RRADMGPFRDELEILCPSWIYCNPSRFYPATPPRQSRDQHRRRIPAGDRGINAGPGISEGIDHGSVASAPRPRLASAFDSWRCLMKLAVLVPAVVGSLILLGCSAQPQRTETKIGRAHV